MNIETVELNAVAEVAKTEGTLGSFESKIVYNGNGKNTDFMAAAWAVR